MAAEGAAPAAGAEAASAAVEKGIVVDVDRPRRDDFVSLKYLGEGSVGSVTKVMHKSSGNVYALKTIDKQRVIEHGLDKQLLAEVATQMTVNHENLLRCFDYFEESGNVYLVLEFAGGGDLYRLLRSRPGCRLDEPDAAHVFAQIVSGIRHLHGQGIIHRDLKPENILLASAAELSVKVADFGWAAKVGGRTTFCGTLCMLAPEMVTGQTYDTRVDIWALGVLLFEMLAGASPFDRGGGLMETCKNIVGGLEASALEKVPEAARPLVRGLLDKEAEKRTSLVEVIADAWLVAQLAARAPAKESAGESVESPTDRPSSRSSRPTVGAGSAGAGSTATASASAAGSLTGTSGADPSVGRSAEGDAAPSPEAPEEEASPAPKGPDWDLPSTNELLVEKLPGNSGQRARGSPAPPHAAAGLAEAVKPTPHPVTLQEVEEDGAKGSPAGASQPSRRSSGELLRSLDLEDEESSASNSSPSRAPPPAQAPRHPAPPKTQLEIAALGVSGGSSAREPDKPAKGLFIPPTRGGFLMDLEPEDSREKAQTSREKARLPVSNQAPSGPPPPNSGHVPVVFRPGLERLGPAVKAPSPHRTPQGSFGSTTERPRMSASRSTTGSAVTSSPGSAAESGREAGPEYHGFRMNNGVSVGPGEARHLKGGGSSEPRSEPRNSRNSAGDKPRSSAGDKQPDVPVPEWISGALRLVGLDQTCAANPGGSIMSRGSEATQQADQRVAMLTEMGFSREQAVAALKRSSTVEGALSWLAGEGHA